MISSLLISFLIAAAGSQLGQPTPPPLDHARHGHDLEVQSDGTWLVLGGFADDGREARGIRDCLAWKPGSETWEARGKLPHDHSFAGSVQVNGVVHIVGDGVWRYEAEQDIWKEVVAPGALPKTHFGCAANDEKLYVIGGYPAERGSPHVVDLAHGKVEQLPRLPGFEAGHHFHIVVVLGERLHVIGGLADDVLDQHFMLDDGMWVDRPRPPTPVWAKFAVIATHGSHLWVFHESGGQHYDATREQWRERRSLKAWFDPPMLAMPAAHSDGRIIEVIGGVSVEGPRAPVRLRYDVAGDLWSDLRRAGG